MEEDKLKIYGMHAGATSEIFRNAAMLRRNMTESEKILWDFLKLKPDNFKFRRQHPFNKYVLDFYCHKKRLSIEVDGSNHDYKHQKEMDAIRTKELLDFGIAELRIKNDEIMNCFIIVKKRIIDRLREDSL